MITPHRLVFGSTLQAAAALVGLAALGGPAGGAGEPPATTAMTHKLLLERFDQLTPAARMKLVAKVDATKELTSATQRDIVANVLARGSLEPVKASDVICTVRGLPGTKVATTIRWLAESGTVVKKGDAVVLLDDAAFQEQLQHHKRALEDAQAQKRKAEASIATLEKTNRINERSAAIDEQIARLLLARAESGTAVGDIAILKLKAEQAKLAVDRIKALSQSLEAAAQATVPAATKPIEAEQDRVRELAEQIENCRVTAPQDGVVRYYPAGPRIGQQSVAQGEPVREGQKLVKVCALTHYAVRALVAEIYIRDVQVGQKVKVRVDAFPGSSLPARVEDIASVPSAADFFANDVKLFPVQVVLTGIMPRLRPDMSAEAVIEVGYKAEALCVPLQAVVRAGERNYCYVRSEQGIEKRAVVSGTHNAFLVEIKAGLKEGDEVLCDPRSLLRRLRSDLAPPVGGEPKAPAAADQPIHVRSVFAPPDGTGLSSWVRRYGLTERDLEQMQHLHGLATVVAMRRFPQYVRQGEHEHAGVVVATVPEAADLLRLELEYGRVLTSPDMEERRNVAVLGAAVATALFGTDDAVGQTVVLFRQPYMVVGVLQEKNAGAGPDALAPDQGIFIPLPTCRSLFGERVIIRKNASRTAERVEVSDVFLQLADPADRAATVERIRTILEDAHLVQDWKVHAGG